MMSVMSAHITLPSFMLADDPGLEAYRPASLSKKLTNDLLRGRLGFNGVTRGRIFFDWFKLMGNFRLAMRRTWHEVPPPWWPSAIPITSTTPRVCPPI